MRRADRLLQIIQILRRRKKPTTAASLAEELEVSLRTIYRDMAALTVANVPIAGEAGVGYVLGAGYDLPPLMFTAEEIEAVVLGARFIAQRGDAALAKAAADAVVKVEAVLPPALRAMIARTALFAPPKYGPPPIAIDLGVVRAAIREARKLAITYRDQQNNETARRIWPIALVFFTDVAIVGAWCELKEDFRHFRADRILTLELLAARYDPRGGKLVQDYLAQARARHPRAQPGS